MSIFLLQIIIKQWDKGQRTAEDVARRAAIPDRYSIDIPPAFYAFENRSVIDQHGDDLLGDRLNYSQDNNGNIAFDRFRIGLKDQTLEYLGLPESGSEPSLVGSLENQWIQCQYDWRYSIYEGGLYYWLYEDVTLNLISTQALNKNIFLNSVPSLVFSP